MIEKLDRHIKTEENGVRISCPPTQADCIEKINELVDVINALVEENNIHEMQIDELQMKIEPEKCEPTDLYAEQRKWVGCLCWFWDFKRVNAIIGVLTDFEIDEPHFRKDGLAWYEHCEPVKPDDDIIYKKEDQCS